MDLVRPRDVTPFEFGGLLIRDLTSESLDSASLAQINLAPGIAHPRAKSVRSDKLYVCIEGTVAFSTDSGSVRLEPMDLLVIRKNEWFEYRNGSGEPAVLLLVHAPSFELESEVFHQS